MKKTQINGGQFRCSFSLDEAHVTRTHACTYVQWGTVSYVCHLITNKSMGYNFVTAFPAGEARVTRTFGVCRIQKLKGGQFRYSFFCGEARVTRTYGAL